MACISTNLTHCLVDDNTGASLGANSGHPRRLFDMQKDLKVVKMWVLWIFLAVSILDVITNYVMYCAKARVITSGSVRVVAYLKP